MNSSISHVHHDSAFNQADETAVRVIEYTCGLSRTSEHARIHRLLSEDDAALELSLAWEAELLALVDALPPVTPSPAVRERLQRTLNIGPPPPPPSRELLQRPAVGSSLKGSGADNTSTRTSSAGIAPSTHAEPGPQSSNAGLQTPSSASSPSTTVSSSSGIAASEPITSTASESVSVGTPVAEPNREPQHMGARRPTETGQHSGAKPQIETRQPTWKTNQSGATEQTVSTTGSADHSGTEERAPTEHKQLVRQLWIWRLIAITATAAAVVAFLLPGEPPPPPVQIVKLAPTRAAILQAPGTSSTPGWTATLDPEGNLMMRPLVQTEVPPGSQTLLWTRSSRIPEPRLLGSIDPNRPVQVPAAQLGALADDQLIEITLEKDEDAAAGLPNGPILFIGQMTLFGAEGSTSGADAMRNQRADGATTGPHH